MQVQQMIAAHPDQAGSVDEALVRCIGECYACAQTCTSCADACLAEGDAAKLRRCIRLNLDCADLCIAAGAIVTRHIGPAEDAIIETLDACAAACRLCGEECERHASRHEHCRICADTCFRCEQACRDAIRSIRSLTRQEQLDQATAV